MASQRQAGSRTANAKGGPGGGQGAAGRTRGGKTAAGRAQAREARAAAEAAAAATAAGGGGGGDAQTATAVRPWRRWAAEATTPTLAEAPRWLRWTTFVLTVIGFGVSIYLTIEHFTSNNYAGCAATSGVNCVKVTTSSQSMVFGVLPVAVLGLAFFTFMVAINLPLGSLWRLRSARWLRLGSLVIGIGFVLYLVYAELFQIQAICLYCTSVHIITFLLFVLVVFDATFRNAPADADT
jgi:uncharacterized membrane protein